MAFLIDFSSAQHRVVLFQRDKYQNWLEVQLLASVWYFPTVVISDLLLSGEIQENDSGSYSFKGLIFHIAQTDLIIRQYSIMTYLSVYSQLYTEAYVNEMKIK